MDKVVLWLTCQYWCLWFLIISLFQIDTELHDRSGCEGVLRHALDSSNVYPQLRGKKENAAVKQKSSA